MWVYNATRPDFGLNGNLNILYKGLKKALKQIFLFAHKIRNFCTENKSF